MKVSRAGKQGGDGDWFCATSPDLVGWSVASGDSLINYLALYNWTSTVGPGANPDVIQLRFVCNYFNKNVRQRSKRIQNPEDTSLAGVFGHHLRSSLEIQSGAGGSSILQVRDLRTLPHQGGVL